MDDVAGGDQVDVPLVILLKREAIAMVAPTVGFDNHFLVGPEEVDEMPVDQDVDRWSRQIHLPTQSEEVDLRNRLRLQCLRIDFKGDPSQLSDALAPPPTGDDAR